MPSAALKLQRRRDALSVLVASIPNLPEQPALPSPRRRRSTRVERSGASFIPPPVRDGDTLLIEEIPTCLEWHDGHCDYRPLQGYKVIMEFSTLPISWVARYALPTRVEFQAEFRYPDPHSRELVYHQMPQGDGTYFSRPPAGGY